MRWAFHRAPFTRDLHNAFWALAGEGDEDEESEAPLLGRGEG